MGGSVTEPGLIEVTQQVLGWPSRDEIFSPKGGAKKVLADSADRKIGGALRRLTGEQEIRVGFRPQIRAVTYQILQLLWFANFPVL